MYLCLCVCVCANAYAMTAATSSWSPFFSPFLPLSMFFHFCFHSLQLRFDPSYSSVTRTHTHTHTHTHKRTRAHIFPLCDAPSVLSLLTSLTICVSVLLHQTLSRSASVFRHLPVCLQAACMSARPSNCRSACLPVCLPVCLSVCMSCLHNRLSVCRLHLSWCGL